MVFPRPASIDLALVRSEHGGEIRWNLPVTVSVEVFPNDHNTECFLVASDNRKGWGEGGDALTASAAVDRDSFTFRAQVFGSFPRVERHGAARLTFQAWNRLDMAISERGATYSINLVKIASVSFEDGDLPSATPFIGLYGFSQAYMARGFSVLGSASTTTAAPRRAPVPRGPGVLDVQRGQLAFPVPGRVAESTVAARSGDGSIRWRLPVRVMVEVFPMHPTTECFFIITENKKGWTGGDGITAAAGVNRYDFTFRGQVFGTFPRVRRFTDAVMLRLGDWNLMTLEVSEKEATYYINDAPIATTKFRRGDLPTTTPFIGVYGFKEAYQVRNFRVMPLGPDSSFATQTEGAIDTAKLDHELAQRLSAFSNEEACDIDACLGSLQLVRQMSEELSEHRADLQLDSCWEVMSRGGQLVALVWDAATGAYGKLESQARGGVKEACKEELPAFFDVFAEASAGRGVTAVQYAYHLAEDVGMGSLPCFDHLRQRVIQAMDLPAYWDLAEMQTIAIPAACGLRGDEHDGKNLFMKGRLSPGMVEALQKLVDSSFRKVYTRDRRGGKVPDALEVVDAFCIQNAVKWYEYKTRQAHVRAQLEKLKSDGAAMLLSVDGMKTRGILPSQTRFALDETSNDAWLWHGTSPQAAEAIAMTDFRLDRAGTHAGSLFGKGIYFAECCSKSDEYTHEDGDGLRYLLLCRVTLGNVFLCEEARPDQHALVNRCLGGRFHSVLGDREKIHSTFREFVIYDDDQCVPEYLLSYKRVYK